MECNKEEATRAREMAEEKMRAGDFIGAKKLVMRAQRLFPNLDHLPQLVAICDVHCSAQAKISGLENWYGILQIDHHVDEATIRKQYRKLALLLHPDKNKFIGAEEAFKLIGEANRFLTDRTKRFQYDIKYRIVSRVASNAKNKQSNTNSVRQYMTPKNASNSTGNQMPGNLIFSTSCSHCGFKHKYLRESINTLMRCCSCQRSFIAVNIGGSGEVSSRSSCAQFSSQKEASSQQECNIPQQSNNNTENTGVRTGSVATTMGTNTPTEEKLKDEGDSKKVRDEREVEKEKRGMKSDVEISKSDVKKGSSGNEGEVRMGDVEKPQSEATEPGNGAETVTVKSKNRMKRRMTAQKSRDSTENDDCDNVGAEKGTGGSNKRRSSRKKQKVSYADHRRTNDDDDDDDFVSVPMKRSKVHEEVKSDHSDGSATQEAVKKMADKHEDSKFEDILGNKVKQNEGGKSKVDETDNVSEGNGENPAREDYPDPEFHDFAKDWSSVSVNQVWAIYDPLDGMPRFYARIKKINKSESTMQIRWLEALPVTREQKKETEESISAACGKFELGEFEDTEDLLILSHMMCGINKLTIYPRRGEVWALFRDWNMNWVNDRDGHKPPYRYDVVEIVSECKDETGITVHYLQKVKGFVSVFARVLHGGIGERYIPPKEMCMFSHNIPKFELKGTEKEGVPAGSFELDPAALPRDLTEIERPAPDAEVVSMGGSGGDCCLKKRQKTESENGSLFKGSNGVEAEGGSTGFVDETDRMKESDKDEEIFSEPAVQDLSGDKNKTLKSPKKNLRPDYASMRRSPRFKNRTSDDNNEALPKVFDFQTSVSSDSTTRQFNFKAGRSEDKFQVNQIWAIYSEDKGMPTEYGQIKNIETTPRFNLYVAPLEPCPASVTMTRHHPISCGIFKIKPGKPKVVQRSSFSHQVNAVKVKRNRFEVYPREGEIWAMFKNSSNTSSADADEYNVVEVVENSGKIIKVRDLTDGGTRTRYVCKRSEGSEMDVEMEDVGRFSHRIPAFRHETGEDGSGGWCWELDPCAVPGLTIVID